jgi:Zn-dependent M28 family amino/carboxypeptidase
MKNMLRLLSLDFLIVLTINLYGQTQESDSISSVRIRKELTIITKTDKSRNYENVSTLNYIARYIFEEFSKNCDSVYYQNFSVNGVEYKNVIGIYGKSKPDQLIIGAHYDVAGSQEGADDNASGIVGLLELSHLLKKDTLQNKIELVAYSLEEPPFFKTEKMGSFIHAKSIFDAGQKIKGMICLEMIGYYSDAPNSQKFPSAEMEKYYGNKGDFIAVVQKKDTCNFIRDVQNSMQRQTYIRAVPFIGSESTVGVDFSDHLNYWSFGYPAIMITNTAFYRNSNYHKRTDRIRTLDLIKMNAVIKALHYTVVKL